MSTLIVNNLQPLSGDTISVFGNLSATTFFGDGSQLTGISGITNEVGVYNALMTQTDSFTGTTINDFGNALIKGETYLITNYVPGDSFSNVAQVISGNIDETDCVFIATGETPYIWSNGSELVSYGNLVVDVLENTLGFDIDWKHIPFGGQGYYVGANKNTGLIYNAFNRTSVMMSAEVVIPINGIPYWQYFASPASLSSKDACLLLYVLSPFSSVDGTLYYTPVQVKIKKDMDTAPITISGTVTSSYPFSNVSVDLICGLNYVESFNGDPTVVNDISELIAQLNLNQTTSYLGSYSDDGLGGVLLTMPTNLKRQFCPDGTLRFEVYAD